MFQPYFLFIVEQSFNLVLSLEKSHINDKTIELLFQGVVFCFKNICFFLVEALNRLHSIQICHFLFLKSDYLLPQTIGLFSFILELQAEVLIPFRKNFLLIFENLDLCLSPPNSSFNFFLLLEGQIFTLFTLMPLSPHLHLLSQTLFLLLLYPDNPF